MKALLILLFFFQTFLTFADENCDSDSDLKSCHPELNEQKAVELLSDSIKSGIDGIVTQKVCTHFNSFAKSGVAIDPLKQALNYYINNQSKFKNKRYISIADYSKNSKEKRYYLLDLITGSVESYHVSHGSGKIAGVTHGDPNHDGMIDSCKISDEVLKKSGPSYHKRWAMTRPGFFSTANLANSTAHDPEIRPKGAWPMISTTPRLNKLILNGLNSGVNDDALRNGVVMHEAWYNTADIMGRSFGCPAFRPKEGRIIMNKIIGGSLFYAYVPKCSDDMDIVHQNNPRWESVCKNYSAK